MFVVCCFFFNCHCVHRDLHSFPTRRSSDLVVIAWAVALPRLVPSTFGDHGTYASVAERLIAGDRLYVDVWDNKDPLRSEEHTSELQSHVNLVCRLLLEKKKINVSIYFFVSM